MTNNEEQALKDFLLDIDSLKQLDDWTDDFNLFEVLRITIGGEFTVRMADFRL